MALDASDGSCGKKVYTLGSLIHNPQVLADLESRGVAVLDEDSPLPEARGAVVVIRAHGVGPRVEARLGGLGFSLIDATCPRVKASQLKVRSLARAGRALFLAGERSHAEIAGILGYAEGAVFCEVVADAAEAEAAARNLAAKPFAWDLPPALVAQTTISQEEYSAIAAAVERHFPNLETVGTICGATCERQESLRELLARVDAVVVIGGRESANTRRLLAIAESSGKPCVLAETAADIPPGFSGFATVGITAGASTPDFVIDEVERALGSR